MNISAIFIGRPIATTLLMAALLVGGAIGYYLLPVAALPTVDFPTISVSASLPGADPETMAASVAQPLERQFADIPGIIGIWRQPGANTIDLVDKIKAELPALQAGIPPSMKLSIISDRSTSIRQSFADIKLTLMGTLILVIIVIFVFLRNVWATLIPAVTVPLSLVGTFGAMYMLGYTTICRSWR